MSKQKVKSAILWIRRDFRIADNPALHQALESADQVVLLYIHAPEEELPWQPGAASNWWLHHSLLAFQKQLNQQKSSLVIRTGSSLDALLSVCNETGARSVYWNRLYEPALIARDTAIKSQLAQSGIDATSFNGALLREPWEVHKDNGEMYRVYTPFSRKYLQLAEIEPPLDAVKLTGLTRHNLPGTSIEALNLLPSNDWDKQFYPAWTPGESAGLKQLQRFLEESVMDYSEDRDLPSVDGVSRLSPHLHFGEISPRQIWHEVRFHAARLADEGRHDALERVHTYLKQLIWRDFAHHILYHLPHTTDQPFNIRFKDFQWQQNTQLLHAWQQGQTGIPLVDAGMRQLWQTGWMHNRVRMLVASVLTKNGLVHWLEGAHWFWDTLVDASLANNSMGWQWTAGCGVDAAPYYRIFSPARQGERFDKYGEYVKTWVPELAALPHKYIHEPWKAPQKVLDASGISLGKTYPLPVVDLASSRKQCLEHYQRMKQA